MSTKSTQTGGSNTSVRKYMGPKAPNGMRSYARLVKQVRALKKVVTTKLRVVATVASNGGGQITFAYSDNPSSLRDWSSFATLYDEYKVKAIKIQYYPYLPNDTSTVTGFLPLYSVYDDNTATNPLTAVNDAIEYENCKQYNMYRPWKRYQRMIPLAANATTVVRAGGWVPTASPAASQCVAFYGEGYDISTSYGSIVVTMYIKFRSRK